MELGFSFGANPNIKSNASATLCACSSLSQLIVNALSPAKVVSATADDEEKKAEIIVSEQQLSLAIGKSGQNVRLAAKLTGFGIDIKSEAQANEDIDETAGDEEDVELTLSEEE